MTKTMHWIVRSLAAIPLIASIAVVDQTGAANEEATNGSVGQTNATKPSVLRAPTIAADTIPPLFATAYRLQSASADERERERERPELIGIAGRLPDDVEILLRMPEGNTMSLRVGERTGDWQLVSVAADRAVFSDRQRQMVLTLNPLP